MIKVNLLESVTDRAGGVAAVEARVANPRTQGLLVLLVVVGLLVAGSAFDWMSARSERAETQAELGRQKEFAARMDAIKREMGELEKKTKEVQTRIDAIKQLRASQQGPVAVLSAVNERLPKVADFRLDSLEQKGGELTVTGDSPDEAAVTQFGRSMEFSSGLFSNVSIEISRKALDLPQAPAGPAASSEAKVAAVEAPKPTTVGFTLKCKYTAPGSKDQKPAAPANQIAQK
jgi:Tfp pilus assembly protein PilN